MKPLKQFYTVTLVLAFTLNASASLQCKDSLIREDLVAEQKAPEEEMLPVDIAGKIYAIVNEPAHPKTFVSNLVITLKSLFGKRTKTIQVSGGILSTETDPMPERLVRAAKAGAEEITIDSVDTVLWRDPMAEIETFDQARYMYSKQFIHRSSVSEREVLISSNYKYGPARQVIRLIARNVEGVPLASKTWNQEGSSLSPSGLSLHQASSQFMSSLKADGVKPYSIEVIFNRPAREFHYDIYSKKDQKSVRHTERYPLSEQEQASIRAVMLMFKDLMVKTTAVTPNGYSYSKFWNYSQDFGPAVSKSFYHYASKFGIPLR